MGKTQKKVENHSQRDEQRRAIGLRVQRLRLSLPPEESQLSTFAASVDLSDSLLSRIESGKASLPFDAVERIANVTGQHPEAITTGNPYPDIGDHPFREAGKFIKQAELLGVDGLFADRAAALGHLLPFAKKMRKGRVNITASSLRGLEQKSEHRFVRRLMEFGRNPNFEVQVIMTHPKLGSRREYQEHRPTGSIVREILTGINWCLDVWNIAPSDIRLSIASPSSFSIFLIDGPEGRGIINPYPTMRQAFLSYTLAVRNVPAEGSAGEAVSIFQTYLAANFREPWQDENVTVGLEEGLEECWQCIQKKGEGSEELESHRDTFDITLRNCREKGQQIKEGTDGTRKGRIYYDQQRTQNSGEGSATQQSEG